MNVSVKLLTVFSLVTPYVRLRDVETLKHIQHLTGGIFEFLSSSLDGYGQVKQSLSRVSGGQSGGENFF